MIEGWRGRLGFMLPAPGIASSYEMRALCPEGVGSVVVTTPIRQATVEGNREALAHLESGIGQLANADVGAIVHVAAIPSIVLGPRDDEQLLQRSAKVTPIPVVLAMRATVDALSKLGIHRVAAVNPLASEMIPLATAYLEAHGVTALSCPVIGVTSPIAVHGIPPGAAYRHARQALSDAPDAEALLFLGGGWRTLDVVEALAFDTGKPVLSTNIAVVWAALKVIGVRPSDPRFGALLSV